MTVSLTVTSPPKRTQSPLTFQAEHSEAVPRRAALARSAAACSAGQASPSPPPQRPSAPAPPARARGSGQPCDSRKPLPNPRRSGRALTPPSLRCFTPRNQPGSSWKGRGAGGSSHCPQSPVENRARGSPFVCLSLSIFHCSRWSSSCGQQGKKEITGFSCTVCY